jgi:hypothetical protein
MAEADRASPAPARRQVHSLLLGNGRQVSLSHGKGKQDRALIPHQKLPFENDAWSKDGGGSSWLTIWFRSSCSF